MRASKSMRIWFAFVGAILWTGIYLTGFSRTSWVLMFPPLVLFLELLQGYARPWLLSQKYFLNKHKK